MVRSYTYLMLVAFMFILIYVSPTTRAVEAEGENCLFSIVDPAGDDSGPGSYQYPTNEVFNQEGLFDITSFSIKDRGGDYQLGFGFTRLTDPWQGKFGFSLPLIEIYIDNQEGGSQELYRAGANVRLDPDHPWDRLLKLSGWWLRSYQPDTPDQQLADFWDSSSDPGDVEQSRVRVVDNDILVSISKDITGDLAGAALFILVGGFDPFGQDHFRKIESSPSNWSFADLSHDNLEKAPRVIDLILPPGRDQQEVLSAFTDEYPVIYPIRVRINQGSLFNLNKYYYLLLLLIIPLVIFFRRHLGS